MEKTEKKKYIKCKYFVKKWESEFTQVHGSKPCKADIKNAPVHIKEAYRTYWKLKTICLETSLVDVSFGDEDTMDGFSFDMKENTANITKLLDESVSLSDTLLESTRENESPKHVESNQIQESSMDKSDLKPLENKCATVLQVNKENTNKSSVWGSHLSNINKKVDGKPKSEIPAAMSRYTEKLFAGATFKKRNPRKTFIRREKSCDSSTSQLDDSQNSINADLEKSIVNSNTTNTSIVVEKSSINENPEKDLQSLDINKFKIINTPQAHCKSQPVSLLQKTLITNSSMKPLGTRIVDKGWLDRVDKLTCSEIGNKVNSSDSGIELTDSSVVSDEPKSSPPCPTVLQDNNSASDSEDFVYDSDSEGEKSKSFCSFSGSLTKTSSFSKFKCLAIKNEGQTLPVCDLKRASCSESSLETLQNKSQFSNTAKRPIDKIDNDVIVSESKKSKVVISDQLPERHNNRLESTISHFQLPPDTAKSTHQDRIGISTLTNRHVDNLNSLGKTKDMRDKEILEKKLSSGKANENFVKINIKKKTYVRGKKTMTFQKYKKQMWKKMKGSQSSVENGVYKCFKCGDIGHFSKNCNKACDQLMPVEDLDEEEESPFPSLQEAEELALEASKKLCVQRHLNDLPTHVAQENFDIGDLLIPPPIINDDIMRFTTQEPVFKLNDDGSVIDTPLSVLEALIRLGFERFRPGQECAVMRVLSGQSTLVTLSTGSGKSLCYQLPAYLYHTLQQRITIVVSPLVSLMEDQVFGVPACLRVACLHTNQPPKVREAVYEQIRANSLHALLISPEALSVGDRVNELLRSLPPIAFACIDEAHCISQWSHNFRPSYLMICQVLREKFGVKTILGLTATASQATIASISDTLKLPDGVGGVIRDRPMPDNLRLSVSRDKVKDLALIDLLKGQRFAHCRSIIVYCTRRDQCERLAAYIRTCLQDDSMEDGKRKRGKLSWNAEAYHAGLTAAKRKAVQKSFMSGKTRIVVATVAFGMGINKHDIQGIIHYNMPNSFERYVQEVGRAGRDGLIAHCHLFLNTEGEDLSELRRHIYADSVERHTIRKLLQRVFMACSCGKSCPTHEVAFSVEETVSALDLPEENIATLLCYLELHSRQWVHVCSRTYTQARILSYKGPKLIKQAVKECPPLAMAVALEMQKGKSLEKVTKLEFPIFPVAEAMKWDSGIVKQQLKNLEWTKVNDQPRRSGLTVELYDLGFRVQAPGNLSGEELDCALDSLTARVEAQQSTALLQLEAIFHTLVHASHTTVDDCVDQVDDEKCEQLKAEIRNYFSEKNYLDKYNLPEVSLKNESQVVNDIRNLINSYRDNSFSGRAVARIFHGIPSPNFSAQQWGRCRFWRAHLSEDFKLISRLATRELIKMR